MIDDQRPHEGAEIFSTSKASELTGVPVGTIGSWKGRGKFAEPDHCFKNPEDGKLYWTEAGIQKIKDLDRDANAGIAEPQARELQADDQGDTPTLDQFADDMATAIARDIVWGEVRKRIPSAITREIIRLLSLADAKREFQGIAAEWISPLQSDAIDSAVRIQMIEAGRNGHRALTGVSDEN